MGIKDFIELRPMRTFEINFILNSWLKSVRITENWIKIESKIFFEEYQKLIIATLEMGSVLIACPKNEPNIIIGYMVYERAEKCLIIHFLYIKNKFRRNGLARYMIESLDNKKNEVIATHYHIKFKGSYNPFIFYANYSYALRKNDEKEYRC
jgi:hypothetical protein